MHPSPVAAGTGRVERLWRAGLLPWVLVLLSACAQAPRMVAPDTALWADAGLGPPATVPDADAALRADAAMQVFLERHLRPAARRQGAMAALIEGLRSSALQVDYDASTTRTAAETLASRSGNCLSLVLLTAALAEDLGLSVEFREVLTDTQWSRLAGLHVGSTHVNLALAPRAAPFSQSWATDASVVIDFLPPEAAGRMPARRIHRARLLAMYLNNRAAEWLVQGDLATARAWSLAAISQDPAYPAGYNTLGVVLQRHGRSDMAELAWRQGLTLAAQHPALLANLAAMLHAQGRTAEALPLDTALARIEGTAPFTHLARGLAALRAGDPATAREWLLKELARDPDYHETHFALAQAELLLGHPAQALDHLQRASAESPRPDLRSLYLAKAERLRAAGMH
ncbi:MAG: tetratricopeptide repeat protein [Burkholderiales bacterium]|nr:tetratricopeptide repeat protein [Burkholderiales bacterium]